MIELLLCTSLFLLIFYYIFLRKTVCNLPGPKGLPLLGSVFEINLKSLYLKLYQWTSEYGEIFQFSLFGVRVVCLNSSDLIREGFSQEPNATHLSSRPPTFFGRYLIDNYGDVVLSPLSKEWARRRKLFSQVLHAYGEGMVHIEKQISPLMKEVIEGLANQSGTQVDPQNIVEEFILSNIEVLEIESPATMYREESIDNPQYFHEVLKEIINCTFRIVGKRGNRSKELQRLMKKIDDDTSELGNPGIDILYSLFPFLRFLPLPASRLIQGYRKRTFEMMNLLTNMTNENPESKGIFHHLLEVKYESDTFGSKWFTDANMRDMVLNVVVAGYLTTRGTLMSAILLLSQRTDVQNKLHREITEKIGDREILISDREDCPYVEAVTLETLRFISHVPLSIMHYTSVDCELRGYCIPKNSIIVPNLWTAHHSQIWDDPFTFRPERFLSDSGELLPATHTVRKRLIAFGYGKRSCIGENFAKSRIFLFLANLLKHFSILETDYSPELHPTEMIPGVALQPKKYKVVFQPHVI